MRHELICADEPIEPDAEMSKRVDEAVAPHRAFFGRLVGRVHSPLDRATSLEASMDNVRLDAIVAAAGTRLVFSNGWRYGAPIQPGRIYRAAMLGKQGVPSKCGSKWQKIGIDAIQSLQQLFARGTQVRGRRRGSVVAI